MTREECCAVVSEKEMPMTVYDMVAAMHPKDTKKPTNSQYFVYELVG